MRNITPHRALGVAVKECYLEGRIGLKKDNQPIPRVAQEGQIYRDIDIDMSLVSTYLQQGMEAEWLSQKRKPTSVFVLHSVRKITDFSLGDK